MPFTTDDMLTIIKLAREEMNYTSMNTRCTARTPGLGDVRKGDLVRKEYSETYKEEFGQVAKEYVAKRDRDAGGNAYGTYIVLERPNPLEDLGIGAVVEYVTDGGLGVTLVKTGEGGYTITTENTAAGATTIDEHAILKRGTVKVLTRGYKPEQ